jgi:hypothetical protein
MQRGRVQPTSWQIAVHQAACRRLGRSSKGSRSRRDPRLRWSISSVSFEKVHPHPNSPSPVSKFSLPRRLKSISSSMRHESLGCTEASRLRCGLSQSFQPKRPPRRPPRPPRSLKPPAPPRPPPTRWNVPRPPRWLTPPRAPPRPRVKVPPRPPKPRLRADVCERSTSEKELSSLVPSMAKAV